MGWSRLGEGGLLQSRGRPSHGGRYLPQEQQLRPKWLWSPWVRRCSLRDKVQHGQPWATEPPIRICPVLMAQGCY